MTLLGEIYSERQLRMLTGKLNGNLLLETYPINSQYSLGVYLCLNQQGKSHCV